MTSPQPNPNSSTSDLLDFGSLSAPVDNSGQISIWNVPTLVLDFEKGSNLPPGSNLSNYGAMPSPFWTGIEQVDTGIAHAPKSSTEPANVYKSASDLYSALMQMSVGGAKDQADFANVQNALANGPWGSISNQELATHQFGVDTERVLGNAMDKYIQLVYASGIDATPMTFQQYLGQASGIDPLTGKPKPGYLQSSSPSRAPLALANPEDLKATAQQAAVAALGQALPEDALNSFVDNFHNLQQQQYNQEVNGSPTVTGAPSASAAALEFVKQQEPHEFAQNEVRTYANALLNELLSGNSTMPTGNIDNLAAMNG